MSDTTEKSFEAARIEELEQENERLRGVIEELLDGIKTHATDVRFDIENALDDHERKIREIVEKAEADRG